MKPTATCESKIKQACCTCKQNQGERKQSVKVVNGSVTSSQKLDSGPSPCSSSALVPMPLFVSAGHINSKAATDLDAVAKPGLPCRQGEHVAVAHAASSHDHTCALTLRQ